MYVIFFPFNGSEAIRPHYKLLSELSNGQAMVYSENIFDEISNIHDSVFFVETSQKEYLPKLYDAILKNNNKLFKANRDLIDFFNDKWETYLFLVQNKFKQQQTFLIEDNLLKFPFVVKTVSGNKGAEVFLVNNDAHLQEVKSSHFGKTLICQKFNDKNIGKDIRVVIFENKLFYYQRNGKEGDFRSNSFQGGHTTPAALTADIVNEIDRLKDCLYLRFPSLREDYFAIDIFIEEDFNIIEMNYNPDLASMPSYFPEEFTNYFIEYMKEVNNK